MKHGQNNRRQRSRGNGRRFPNQRGNSFESNGPEVKVRGTAQQVLEKYQSLARDAYSSGDRILAEGYQQHAEHYQRIINAEAEQQQNRDQNRDQNRGRQRGGRDDDQMDDDDLNDAQGENDSQAQGRSQEQSKSDEGAENAKNDAPPRRRSRKTAPEGEQADAEKSASGEAGTDEEASERPRRGRRRKSEQEAVEAEQAQAGD